MGKRVLVTGSHGYIGQVLCKYLHKNGYHVTGVDHAAGWPRVASKYCNDVVPESFDSPRALRFAEDSDYIFHLAATSEVGPSAYYPSSYFHNNVGRTAGLCDHLHLAGWEGHLVFASTAAVYYPLDQPLNETDPEAPLNNYGLSKLYAERVIEKQCEVEGSFAATVLRFFNVAGAYEDCGEKIGSDHIVTRLCESVIHNRKFHISGDNYPTPDGTCIRDYIHVRDVARAMLHVIENIDDRQFRTYNLGTSKGRSVKEVLESMQRIVSPRVINWDVDVRRKGDPSILVADPSLFIKETDFTYKYSDIDTILKTAWEYYGF